MRSYNYATLKSKNLFIPNFKMTKLLIKISLIITFALLLSVGVDYLHRQETQQEFHWPKNVLPFPEIGDKYELVALGNSHSESGLIFSQYNLRTDLLASVSQSFEYDLAMLKMNYRKIDKNAIILIAISPISFSQKQPRKEDLVNMNYYDGRLSPFLIPNLKVSEYLQIQVAPFVRTGYLWRQEHAKKVAENVAASYALTRGEKIAPTPPPTFAAKPRTITTTNQIIEPIISLEEIQKELNSPPDPYADWISRSADLTADKWYNSGGFSEDSFAKNRKDLEAIINYSLDHHWRPVLITFPISQVLLETVEKDYLKKYIYDNLNATNLHGAPYINLAEDQRLVKSKYLYDNADHLNKKGAAIASYLILQELVKRNYLPKSADEYR